MRYLLVLSMLLMTSACFEDKEKQVQEEAIAQEEYMVEEVELNSDADQIQVNYAPELETQYEDINVTESESVEEVAVVNPAVFTAGGNEPGWRIITKDGQVEITRNYGQDIEVVDLGENSSDNENIQIFNTQNANGENVTIQIEKTYCQDTMSDKEFDYKTTLNYGQEVLNGCGFIGY